MTIKIEQPEGKAPQAELEFFLKGEATHMTPTRGTLKHSQEHANTYNNTISNNDREKHMHTIHKHTHLVPFRLNSLFICAPNTGNLSLEKSKRKKPCVWLPDQGWEDIIRLAEVFPDEFGTLPDDVEKNAAEWKTVNNTISECDIVKMKYLKINYC